MSDKPISPLRRRMIEDMTVRNFVEKTHNDYIRHVRTFTAFLGRAPDTAAPEDLRLFQLHQTQIGVRALGLFFAIAALGMFHLTHRALGRNWSISLDVRENHKLVTEGIYRRVRHPMYSAFWLWAIAQALLLPNWIAGFAGLAGFAVLYFGRVAREERMMLETFGDSYRAYMARTGRVFPSVL